MTETDDTPARTAPATEDDRITHRYDWAETDPSTAVVETIAVAADSEPLETDPLYDVIDPDALNALFDPIGGPGSPEMRVEFTYEDFDVTVRATGIVAVEPAVDASESDESKN